MLFREDSFIKLETCLHINRSNIFDMLGNILTGLYLFHFFSPFLNTGVVFACLNLKGKVEVLTE